MELVHSQQQVRGRQAADHLDHWVELLLAGPRVEPVTRRDERKSQASCVEEGGASQGGGGGEPSHPHCGCRLGRSSQPMAVRPCRQWRHRGASVCPGARCGPQGPSLCSLLLHISPPILSLWNGTVCPLGLLSLIKESPEDWWRLLHHRPVSHGSLNQPHRRELQCWICGYFSCNK